MRISRRPDALLLGFLVAISVLVGLDLRGQKRETQETPNAQVVDFVDLQYPPLVRNARIDGAVVVEVKLNDRGDVLDATVISGPAPLRSASVDNVKKWHFEANKQKSAVIVYNFIILKGQCKAPSSLFIFQDPNLATVLSCPPPPITNP